MKKTKMKAFSMLLAAVLLMPAVHPTAALAKPEVQDMSAASKDLPPRLPENTIPKNLPASPTTYTDRIPADLQTGRRQAKPVWPQHPHSAEPIWRFTNPFSLPATKSII
ncbi:hypothetical protein VQ056_06885 [Paenibacillus sp. JTLBN-2024]